MTFIDTWEASGVRNSTSYHARKLYGDILNLTGPELTGKQATYFVIIKL